MKLAGIIHDFARVRISRLDLSRNKALDTEENKSRVAKGRCAKRGVECAQAEEAAESEGR